VAQADAHSCTQLRSSVSNAVPGISRNLPYDALDCAAISEIYLLTTTRRNLTQYSMNQRIEAIFRREGLIP
jgi:hypothetical protein